ncbi:MAG: sulfotransferase family protein [Verrucomicrobia bacterium]|nr:sulfotransferase family protein [Verrucomicrobiota bacterium]
MSRASDLLDGWLPISITHFTQEPIVDWCRFGARRFSEPFFDHTVQSEVRKPFNLLFRHKTTLDVLVERQATRPGLEPSGFIYHMSRCGSTLACQMLDTVPEHMVLSEPPPMDALLRLDRRGYSEQQRITYLRAWMSAISQPRTGEKRLYVKLDAWHVFDLPLLRRAFPDTPWVFLYRNPLEVLVSAMRSPGLHMIRNYLTEDQTGIPAAAVPSMTQTEYMARILESVLKSALQHLGPLQGKALDYTGLPESVITEIAPHFGLSLTAEQIQVMREKTAFHAKSPSEHFQPDAESKQKEASEEILRLCTTLLDPLYNQLVSRS